MSDLIIKYSLIKSIYGSGILSFIRFISPLLQLSKNLFNKIYKKQLSELKIEEMEK